MSSSLEEWLRQCVKQRDAHYNRVNRPILTEHDKQLERMRKWRERNPDYMAQAGRDRRAAA